MQKVKIRRYTPPLYNEATTMKTNDINRMIDQMTNEHSRTDYTLEIYRIDRRTKTGKRRVGTYDYKDVSLRWIKEEIDSLYNTVCPKAKFVIEMHETWVTRRNLIGGEEFKERYDTPHYCSPSSETYWSS